ncbi:MAG: polyprenyl synthetase family protein [Phycisphaeraceae bacterium]
MKLNLPQIDIPESVPPQVMRETQENIPSTLEERERIKAVVDRYAADCTTVPPVPLEDLRVHAEQLLKRGDEGDLKYVEYAAVLLNNALWRDQLATVPYERRLLLLPKCLRAEATCPAPFDEFGLLCKHCGQCSLQDLQSEAERLGYAVLIAEGSAVVMAIIETGKIDAIVGVSCLDVLEKAFPYMESAAIPGVAIPLLQDDCKDTNVDLEWIWDVVHLTSDDKTHRLDLDSLRENVETWFEPTALDAIMGEPTDETQKIAREWLGRSGKRWRPFLTVCAYQALREGEVDAPLPDDLKKLAVAVECFHKASLVHDDIEDADDKRYDQPTVHAQHGIPVALNVGDLLLGEGYRLIGEVEADGRRLADMLRIAAAGHRDLCLGQGAELTWQNAPRALASKEVLQIFRQKTAPAFDVALRLGAVYAGADDAVHDVIERYSEHLGIAYQIRDDMEDWFGGEASDGDKADAEALRPTLMPALALERCKKADKEIVRELWLNGAVDDAALKQLTQIMNEADVSTRAKDLYDAYKEEAVRSLRLLETPTLKGLLRRVMTKIFNDLEIKGWCREHETSNAPGGEAGAESAA